MDQVVLSERRDLPFDAVVALYKGNAWSSARVPEKLYAGLRDSHTLISAWIGDKLVGLGNAISDGHLVVYYPHFLVLPEFQGCGVGGAILERLKARYQGFHQHMLVADGRAIEFYAKHGFERAGKTEPMWIYAGGDH